MATTEEEQKMREEQEAWESSNRSGRGSEYDSGRQVEAVIARGSRPETVHLILRDHILHNETFPTNVEQRKDFRVQHLSDTLQDREEALSRPLELLVQSGIVELLDDGQRALLNEQVLNRIPQGASYKDIYFGMNKEAGGSALKDGFTLTIYVPESYKRVYLNPGGAFEYKPDESKGFRKIDIPVSYYGSPEQRREAKGRFAEMRNELNLRHDVINAYGTVLGLREALFKLTESMYFRTSISAEGFGRLFNLRGLEGATKKTETEVELRGLGDKIDTAFRLYFINALCEKPEKLRELMKKPGWKKFLFPTKADEEKWVGKVEDWENEAVKIDKFGKLTKGTGKRTKETIKQERKDRKRGNLALKNIFAASDTYVEYVLNNAIEEFMGGRRGKNGKDYSGYSNADLEKALFDDPVLYTNNIEAQSARRVAYKLFRLFLTADVEGFEIYSKPGEKGGDFDPLKDFEVEFENGPAGSDYGKETHPWLYILKSYRRGRDASPMTSLINSTKLYAKVAIDFFRQTSLKKEIKVAKPGSAPGAGPAIETIIEDRSIYEHIWGNEAGGKVPGKDEVYLEEEAARLGDVPWAMDTSKSPGELEKEFESGLPAGGIGAEALKQIYLTGFMMGREGGVFDLITKTNIRLDELMDDGWWRKFWKMLDVGIKDGIVIDGQFKGVSETTLKDLKKQLKVNIIIGFLKGLQGLPQWNELKEDERKISYRNRNNETSKELAFLRLFRIAREALVQEGVQIETETWDQLINSK